AQTVDYLVHIKQPNSHYAEVTLNITLLNETSILDVKMPVWTPGSYLVREFEKSIEDIQTNQQADISKTDKSTWRLSSKSPHKSIKVTYKVYCFEKTVRTSYIDNDHAFFILSSALMYIDNQKGGNIEFKYPKKWSNISCTLEGKNNK